MARIIQTAAAQMGPIAKSETRKDTVRRLIAMMREAKGRGAELVVFTELALTTFFPRWLIEDEAELDSYYEREMPGPADACPCSRRRSGSASASISAMPNWCRRAGASAASTPRSWSTATGTIIGKYRKVHLPGHAEPQPGRTHQHLEKRYFEPGNLGFGVWRGFGGVMGMCICNDRRWPETYRVMGLQGVEMVMLGYNTPFDHTGHADIDGLTSFHNHLSMQAGRVPELDLGDRHRQVRHGGRIETWSARARSSRPPARSLRRPFRSRTRSSPRGAISTSASAIARPSSTSQSIANRRPIA